MTHTRHPPGFYYFTARLNPRTDGHYNRSRLHPPIHIATVYGLFRMTTFKICGYRIFDEGHITHGEAAISRYDPASGITMRATLRFARGNTDET